MNDLYCRGLERTTIFTTIRRANHMTSPTYFQQHPAAMCTLWLQRIFRQVLNRSCCVTKNVLKEKSLWHISSLSNNAIRTDVKIEVGKNIYLSNLTIFGLFTTCEFSQGEKQIDWYHARTHTHTHITTGRSETKWKTRDYATLVYALIKLAHERVTAHNLKFCII